MLFYFIYLLIISIYKHANLCILYIYIGKNNRFRFACINLQPPDLKEVHHFLGPF